METIEVDFLEKAKAVRITTFFDDHYVSDLIFERSSIDDLILKLRKLQTPTRLESPVE